MLRNDTLSNPTSSSPYNVTPKSKYCSEEVAKWIYQYGRPTTQFYILLQKLQIENRLASDVQVSVRAKCTLIPNSGVIQAIVACACVCIHTDLTPRMVTRHVDKKAIAKNAWRYDKGIKLSRQVSTASEVKRNLCIYCLKDVQIVLKLYSCYKFVPDQVTAQNCFVYP